MSEKKIMEATQRSTHAEHMEWVASFVVLLEAQTTRAHELYVMTHDLHHLQTYGYLREALRTQRALYASMTSPMLAATQITRIMAEVG
ncbi:MAG TPA: hypothetical protein PKC67_02485 [Kiritimatiellia bacterium]|nr:hypothetical protein [Kiritimatiellia bacterium]HMP33193.1 hypothetical protein [Kiritimatiellia bacterium]